MSEIEEVILKIVRLSDKALSAKEILNALLTEVGETYPRRTLNYHLEKLVSLKVLKPVLSNLKQAAYIPMNRYKEWSDVKFQERKIHSDDLKREVIEPWIEQLPIMSKITINLPSPTNIIHQYTGEEKLEVENHDLFGDLELHLEPDFLEDWELFKGKVKEFTERRSQILSEIDERLEKATGLKVSDQWENDVLYDGRPSLRVLEEVFARETIVEALMSENLKINSQVSRDGDSLIYSIDGQAYVRVRKGEEDEERFRERFDGIIVDLVEEWKGLVNTPEVSGLFELRQEIENLRDWIRIRLVKYLRKPVFGGDCEYLK